MVHRVLHVVWGRVVWYLSLTLGLKDTSALEVFASGHGMLPCSQLEFGLSLI